MPRSNGFIVMIGMSWDALLPQGTELNFALCGSKMWSEAPEILRTHRNLPLGSWSPLVALLIPVFLITTYMLMTCKSVFPDQAST